MTMTSLWCSLIQQERKEKVYTLELPEVNLIWAGKITSGLLNNLKGARVSDPNSFFLAVLIWSTLRTFGSARPLCSISQSYTAPPSAIVSLTTSEMCQHLTDTVSTKTEHYKLCKHVSFYRACVLRLHRFDICSNKLVTVFVQQQWMKQKYKHKHFVLALGRKKGEKGKKACLTSWKILFSGIYFVPHT